MSSTPRSSRTDEWGSDEEHYLVDAGAGTEGFDPVGDRGGGAVVAAAGVGVENLSWTVAGYASTPSRGSSW